MKFASNYFENKIMSLLLGGEGITPPQELYVALFASSPGETGTEGTEIHYTGYTRMPIIFSGPTASTAGLTLQNSSAITFPEAQSTDNKVQAIGIFDNADNMWLYGDLTNQLNIQVGVSPVFQPEALKWTFTGNLSSTYRQKVIKVLTTPREGVSAFNPYIALFNGDPNNNGRELQGINYARIPVSFQLSSIVPASGALMYENDSEVVSPTAGTGGWGTMTHVAIMDNSVGGNIFASMALKSNTSYVIAYGDVIGFHQGDLTFSIN